MGFWDLRIGSDRHTLRLKNASASLEQPVCGEILENGVGYLLLDGAGFVGGYWDRPSDFD